MENLIIGLAISVIVIGVIVALVCPNDDDYDDPLDWNSSIYF